MESMMFLRSVLVALLMTGFCIRSFGDDASPDWNQWRGPSRDGHLATSEPWPEQLDESKLTELWSVGLGPGYSGPIVVGNRVFVTETLNEEREVVRAFDRNSGEQLWITDWAGAMTVPFFAAANGSWIRATPACDGERLYVAGMRDLLVCLDVENGDIVWQVDFMEKFESPLPAFGFVSSPLIDGGFIYVQAGGGVCKLDKLTGEVIWRVLDDGGGMNGSAFSSPTIVTLEGVRQLAVQTRTSLAGVDLEGGVTLWSVDVPTFRGMNILTPTLVEESIFTSSYGGGTFMYDVSLTDESFAVESQWTDNRNEGYMSSPVLIDGYIYLHLRNQRFTCIDPSTGEARWTTTPYGKYWSMVANGDRILALDERGDLLLIEASPAEFRLVDEMHITDAEAWAHLAVSDDLLLVRDLERLRVYRWSE